ncbi:MAG: tetratricopeptide repeat protein [Woeseiaceae bacterium]|nr:tetratricopeptide repeat protein [Woeseiaceae bacterium]
MMRLNTASCWLRGLCLLAGIAAGHAASATPAEQRTADAPAVPVASEAILATSPAMRDLVDREIRPIAGQEQKARALLVLMFDERHLGLKYDRFGTRTAAETVEAGAGNCLSLANTYIAMARYAGLNASYVAVSTPEAWYPGDEVFYVLNHTTAGIKLNPRVTMTIEFDGVQRADDTKARLVPDERGFAQYYNNIASIHMSKSDFAAASLSLQQALRIDPEYAPAWNSLGVIQKRLGKLDAAESSYKEALNLDADNLSALNNLVILYEHTGRAAAAHKYQDRLERYRRKNPYYLNYLAQGEVVAGNYDSAIRLAKKAIRKRSDEHRFHFTLAQAYSALDLLEKADRHLQEAMQHTDSEEERSRYRREFEQRQQVQSGMAIR